MIAESQPTAIAADFESISTNQDSAMTQLIQALKRLIAKLTGKKPAPVPIPAPAPTVEEPPMNPLILGSGKGGGGAPTPAPTPTPTPTPPPNTLFATQANINTQFAALPDGWTLALSGPIIGWRPANRTFATGVTIDATNAQMSDIYGAHLDGLNFKGGAWTAGATYHVGLRIDDADNCSFEDMTFTGTDLGRHYGLFINGATNLSGARLTASGGMRSAFVFGQVTGLDLATISGTGLGSDLIDLYGVRDFTVDGVTASDFTPTAGAHPDVVQMASAAGGLKTGNGVIRNVVAVGNIQGINGFDHPTNGDLGFENITVELCDLQLAYPQAIAINDCAGLIIRDNRIRTLSPCISQATINSGAINNNTDIQRNRNIIEAYTRPDGRFYPAIIDPDYVP